MKWHSSEKHENVFSKETMELFNHFKLKLQYSHLSNNRGGWNKRGGGAKVAKPINVEVGINVEGRIFQKTST